MADKVTFRRGTASAWSTANPILSDGEPGYETDTFQFKVGDGVTVWSSLPYGGIAGPPNTDIVGSFGDGSDGDVVISSGITTLSNDAYFNNLTINGTGQLVANGYKIFVKGTLDLTAAPANAIHWNGNNGVSATNQTGAAAPAVQTGTTVGQNGSGRGTAGATGTTTAGALATAPSTATPGNGGAGGNGNAGGSGNAGANAGGAVRTGGAVTAPRSIRRLDYVLISGAGVMIQSGGGGAGGSSGGGDGTLLGRGGGSGGNCGGLIAIYAKHISRGASTAVGAISSKGGIGGDGATGAAGQIGGGGGAGGGGGGWVYIVYETLVGTVATGLVRTNGGAGGTAGNGFGTGLGGNGGNGGNGGRVTTFKVLDSTGSESFGSTGTAGNAGSGTLGGSGGAGAVHTVAL